MRILVTGGAGYIGSHACKALALSGYEPVVFDNLTSGHESAVKWGPLVKGDIRNGASLDNAFQEWKPVMVMHFAAHAYVGESVQDPLKYYENNIGGTQSLLAAMKRNGVNAIIFSSTCATYGIPKIVPIAETAQQEPINPYGFTKLAVERMLSDCATAYGLSWCALRYFNAAGADPQGELGEEHDPETHVIPLALQAALGSRRTFQIFGTDYDTPDGTAIRDYIHVSDLADAHVKAVSYLLNGGQSDAFNLATGNGVSVKELVDAVERSTGRKVPVEYESRRAGDPPVLYAVANKAAELLGWRPAFVSIDETVATAAKWFQRKHNAASGLSKVSSGEK
jgi:UDP-arabinose 4-epimerase